MNELLIFDLDDTIFETKSIDKKSVEPIFDKYEKLLKKKFSNVLTVQILSELWKYPFDFVSDKYDFDNRQISEFTRLVNEHDYKLNIKPFDDFSVAASLKQEKILITTGLPKLQNAKIHHLDIMDLFSEIFIDDFSDPERVFKKGIIKNILLKRNIEPEMVYVIGDNPNSELKAGFELGLNVIQVAKFGQKTSGYANHCISNYEELAVLLS